MRWKPRLKARLKSTWIQESRLIPEFRLRLCRRRSSVRGDHSRWKRLTWPRLRPLRNLSRRNLPTDRRDRELPRPVDSQHVRAERTDLLDDRLAEDRVPQPADFLARRERMLLAEAELPRARMDVRTRIVRGSLDQAGLGQVARDQGLDQAGRDRRAMGATVTRDLRVVASRAIETSEPRRRRRRKATLPRDMAWENARGAGRRPAKFQKRPLPAGRHSLPSRQDSSRAEGNFVGRSHSARRLQDRNSAGRNRGNPDRRLAKAAKIVPSRGRSSTARMNQGAMPGVERANRMPRNQRDSNRAAPSPGLRNQAMANFLHAHVLLGKQVIGLNRGSVIALELANDLRAGNHMASRLDLLARDSSPQAHGPPKRDPQTA